ncbi:MAG: hypothetical protein ACPGYT_06635 [Nitrospirales bacterium]
MLLLLFAFYPSYGLAEPSPEDFPQEGDFSGTSLLYVSDYYSFIGQDDQGHVAFAIDMNRGKDGGAYQAEHFVVLHDERQGWIDIQGNGSYDNIEKALADIPDSFTFQYSGNPEFGVTITSHQNDLTLSTSPIVKSLYRTHNGGEVWMGSASAKLQWAERTLTGRVIYEYLMMPEFNRLSRTYWGLWKEYQGFYLSLQGGGDLYIHHQRSDLLTPLIGELDGFLSIKGKSERFQVLQLTPLSLRQALGFYQWPMKWALRWVTAQGGGEVQLELSEMHAVANWVIGGFAMGIIQGTVNYQGKAIPVYGLAELIM